MDRCSRSQTQSKLFSFVSAAAVWSMSGECEIVHGPRRMFTVFKRVRRLRCHVANQFQYIAATRKDGIVENIPGPVTLYENPLEYSRINVLEAISLTADELLVVYRKNGKAASDGKSSIDYPKMKLGYEEDKREDANRHIVRGPTIFVLGSYDWIHEFSWHGEDPKRKAHLLPGQDKFSKLKIIPRNFYYNITDVRTMDDALISVKIMIFYEIIDVGRMLDSTNDPIADIINSACSDVVSFVSARDYVKFVETVNDLNDLERYPQLKARTQDIGVSIQRVVYRGYHANDSLQKMHDEAIEMRTRMRLDAEGQHQLQEVENLKLRAEAERSKAKMEMEETWKKHQQHLRRLENEQRLEEQRLEAQQKLEQEAAKNAADLGKWRAMRDLGIDVTQVIVAPFSTPSKCVRIEHSGNRNRGKGEGSSQSEERGIIDTPILITE